MLSEFQLFSSLSFVFIHYLRFIFLCHGKGFLLSYEWLFDWFSYLSIFYFTAFGFWVMIKKVYPTLRFQRIASCFLLVFIWVNCLLQFSLLIHLEFIIMDGMRSRANFTFLYTYLIIVTSLKNSIFSWLIWGNTVLYNNFPYVMLGLFLNFQCYINLSIYIHETTYIAPIFPGFHGCSCYKFFQINFIIKLLGP